MSQIDRRQSVPIRLDAEALLRIEINDILSKHLLHSDEQRDEFTRNVKLNFMIGIHRAFADSAFRELDKLFKTDADIAEALAFKSRTSISKMRKNRRIDGPLLTYIMNEFDVKPPAREFCNSVGYQHASQYVYDRFARLQRQESFLKLSLEELECLRLAMASHPWRMAQCKRDRKQLEAVGKEILNRVHAIIEKPLEIEWQVRSLALLEQTIADWMEPFLISVWILREEAQP